MCLTCGDMKHFDNSQLMKAIVKQKATKESRAKYSIQAGIEGVFKDDYKSMLNKLTEGIKQTLLKSTK
jgi:hypothetical protein